MALGNVKIQRSTLRNEHFNFGHETFTTLEMGVLQPIHNRLCLGGSTHTVNYRANTRLAPLKNATYGAINQKFYGQFVPATQIWKNFNHFLAQNRHFRNSDGVARTETYLPTISAKVLMWYLSKYGSSQYYIRQKDSNPANEQDLPWQRWSPAQVTDSDFESWNFPNDSPFHPSTELPRAGQFFVIPNTGGTTVRLDYFAPESASFEWWHESKFASSPSHKTLLKLNLLGTRLLSILYSCGMVPSMDSNITYNLLPLFATYKAYYDCMKRPIVMYNNWETTPCYRLIKFFEVGGADRKYSFDSPLEDLLVMKPMFDAFFEDLIHMYYSNKTNDVSVVEPYQYEGYSNGDELYPEFNNPQNIDNHGDEYTVHIQARNNTNPALHLENGSLASFDVEVLKRLYLQANRRHKSGKAIAQSLRARGYDDFVDEIDSTFLFNESHLLPINEIISTADTDSRSLGDYSGQSSRNGITMRNSKFTAKETGYLIVFTCIVPEIKFVNGADENTLATDPSTWYSPLTDSLGNIGVARIQMGFDFTRQKIDIVNNTIHRHSAVFGVLPNHYLKKISHNLCLGMAGLRDYKNTYNNHYIKTDVDTHKDSEKYDVDPSGSSFKTFEVSNVDNWSAPDASEIWRYFAMQSDTNNTNELFEYGNRLITYAEFQPPVHNVESLIDITHHSMSPMIPTELSWHTTEDDKDVNTVTINND